MNSSLINQFISPQRFSSYQDIEEYTENLYLSKDAYIPLSVLEIALRNSIDNLLSETIGVDWIENDNFLTNDSIKKVNASKNILFRRGEKISKEKINAKLSFGFWVNLFKKPYSKKLRAQDLKKVFLNLPAKNDKFISRDILYKQLNHIRNFRNRVFHHEKVLNKNDYKLIFDEIYEILNYFGEDVYLYTRSVNEGKNI